MIGGNDEVMNAIHEGTVFQVGTYSGNPLSMAAARASFEQVMTDAAYAHLNYLNDRLITECDAICKKYDFPGYTVGISSKGCVNFASGKITDYESFIKYQDHELVALAVAVQLQPRRHHRPWSRRGVDAVHRAHRRGHRPLRERLRRAPSRRDCLTTGPEAPARRPCADGPALVVLGLSPDAYQCQSPTGASGSSPPATSVGLGLAPTGDVVIISGGLAAAGRRLRRCRRVARRRSSPR